MRFIVLILLLLWSAAIPAFAALTYPSGTVTFVNRDMIMMNGNTYKLLEKTPVRMLETKDRQTVEINAKRTDIRPGSYVTLHTAGHIVVNVLVERR